jgi:hypothetical protein
MSVAISPSCSFINLVLPSIALIQAISQLVDHITEARAIKMILVSIPCSSRDSAIAKSCDRTQLTLLHIQFPSSATTSLHCNPFVPDTILGLKSCNTTTSKLRQPNVTILE